MRILVGEDEIRLATLLRRGSAEEGHVVDLGATGKEALDWVEVAGDGAVILDVVPLACGKRAHALSRRQVVEVDGTGNDGNRPLSVDHPGPPAAVRAAIRDDRRACDRQVARVG